MSTNRIVISTLDEARQQAGRDAAAPALARGLRARGAQAVCIVDADHGMDWIDTPHAAGWLLGEAQARDAFAAAMHLALDKGFVPADAAIIAKMPQSHALPLLSWGEQPPVRPQDAAPTRRLDLYAIVDSAARLRQVLDAGVRTVQLRIKKPHDADAAWHAMLQREVRQAVEDCAAAQAELFVNDHWRVAHALGAGGVHLGQEDLLALGDEGRTALQATGMALGISSHSLWELARARTLSPRYIACGPIWPTLTKDMPWLPQGLDNLAWWVRSAGTPVTAIGGILEPRHVQEAARTGCDGVCIVRGLGDDPRATLPRFEAALAAGRADALAAAPGRPHPSLPHGAA
ncbi:MAG: phosphomethylpyrimidine kinase / thiamine-phosphate pyrophosphorylase [Moraxellaceae bacterium]|jgi:thiamine-phosphate diphosphorylase|nr:phosphomethylpyrimidine kinase / thiamine-phosphate pyrophosphorylase [Moraxellaceae bacterium]